MSYWLPPDVSKAVTNVQATAPGINAPISTVWKVLLDFPSYHVWNSYVRAQEITDSSFKPLSTHPEPKDGAHVLMHCRLPPRGLDDDDKGLVKSKELITLVDETNHRVVWKVLGLPSWLLRAERWQELTEEHVDGRKHTKYSTVEVFHGPLAWLIRWFLREKLIVSFDVMAQGLKKRSEELAATERLA